MRDIALPLIFETFTPVSWNVDKLKDFLEALSLSAMRAYSKAALLLYQGLRS